MNRCQKGNRVLHNIHNVSWEYANIIPDYQMGQNICSLFLSLRFHQLHKDYLFSRIRQLDGTAYKVRILLCMVDLDYNQSVLEEIANIAIGNDLTLILSWSFREAGRYLETYKIYESKGPETLKGRPKEDFPAQAVNSFCTMRGVNKTDVQVMLQNFGSVKAAIRSTMEELSLCVGVGEKKVKRLLHTFCEPFRKSHKKKQARIETLMDRLESGKTLCEFNSSSSPSLTNIANRDTSKDNSSFEIDMDHGPSNNNASSIYFENKDKINTFKGMDYLDQTDFEKKKVIDFEDIENSS